MSESSESPELEDENDSSEGENDDESSESSELVEKKDSYEGVNDDEDGGNGNCDDDDMDDEDFTEKKKRPRKYFLQEKVDEFLKEVEYVRKW